MATYEVMNRRKRETVVVNLFGPPGVGKSTAMADVFKCLKRNGVVAEMAPEFVKEMLWEKREIDETYVFSKQNHRLFRLNGKVDVVVTDRPLPITALYNPENAALNELVMQAYKGYRNINFLLLKDVSHPYREIGRYQTEEESDALAVQLEVILEEKNIFFRKIISDDFAGSVIAASVMQHLGITPDKTKRVANGGLCRLDYVLVETYAELTQDEYEITKDWDETPTSTIAIRKSWLEEYVKQNTTYASFEEFLGGYIYDTLDGVERAAAADGAVAFVHRPALDEQFRFYENAATDAFPAFADYLSGCLQSAGHVEASKYLDCVFSF